MHVSKQFILAGDAIFTIEIPEKFRNDGKSHYTFKIEHVEKNERFPESWFAKTLVGPDNSTDYAYLGMLDSFTGQVRTTTKSKFAPDCHRLRVLNRILARVWCDDHAAYETHGFETHHEGKCGRCGRRLTVPESIETGIGPECCRIMGLPIPESTKDKTTTVKKPRKARKSKITPMKSGPLKTGDRMGEGPAAAVWTSMGAYTGD